MWSPFPLVLMSHGLALPRSLVCWCPHVYMWHEGCFLAPRSSACSSDVQPTYYCCPSCPGLPDHVGDSKAKLASPTPPHLHVCPAACTAVWSLHYIVIRNPGTYLVCCENIKRGEKFLLIERCNEESKFCAFFFFFFCMCRWIIKSKIILLIVCHSCLS